MKEESNEEIDLHIKEMMEGVEQEKGDRKQARHVAFVEKFNHSAEEGAKMLRQVTGQTCWRGVTTCFRTPHEDALDGAGHGAKFQEWCKH